MRRQTESSRQWVSSSSLRVCAGCSVTVGQGHLTHPRRRDQGTVDGEADFPGPESGKSGDTAESVSPDPLELDSLNVRVHQNRWRAGSTPLVAGCPPRVPEPAGPGWGPRCWCTGAPLGSPAVNTTAGSLCRSPSGRAFQVYQRGVCIQVLPQHTT